MDGVEETRGVHAGVHSLIPGPLKLVNYTPLQHRYPSRDVQKVAKKAVWRDVGEPPIPLDTFRLCIKHATWGALRAGFLAGAIRSGVNLFLLLFRVLRTPKKFRIRLVLHALFGPDTFRFSAMLGSFTFLYKLLLNSLPLIPIPDQLAVLRSHRHTRKHPASDEESLLSPGAGSTGSGTPLTIPSKREKREGKPRHLSLTSEIAYSHLDGARWHAIVAGAIAGLSVLWEKKERRITIAQQIFVRGLQGSWNVWSPRLGIHIPYGSVLAFSLCCGQIMYAFLLRPETILDLTIIGKILKASKVHGETMHINRQLVRQGTFEIPLMESLINKAGNTPHNTTVLRNMLEHAKRGDFQGKVAGTCEIIHPWIDSCVYVEVERFVSVFTWMFPIYGALHVIPMILFKRKTFAKEPLTMLLKSLKGTVRSSTFLSVFVFIYQCVFYIPHSILCVLIIWRTRTSHFMLVSRASFWFLGAMTGLALFVEDQRRRAELTMYVLPRGLESAWSMMRNRGYVPFIPFGDSILCAVGMGMVMHDPQHLSGLVRRILYQFVGPN
ncbi:hypothetical protein BS47DRAFT_1371618 [Hydnum rufescens UP504]|uniref:Transmembrane protein 135 N-terminal domain-containing protein n=1 Tax=Hydnum rufescens UP504 TaxID=1448309 RepID=A0A9P6B3N1_9AGAM|nr:hypothetical protein BS47DRAFT_1371618 [Hydnum rufescens UP504]